MSYRMVVRWVGVVLFGTLLLAVFWLMAPALFRPDVVQLSPTAAVRDPGAAMPVATYDSAEAAEVSAMRWQAMAEFYAQHDMLTRAEPEGDQEPAEHAERAQELSDAVVLLGHNYGLTETADYREHVIVAVLEDRGLLAPNRVDPSEASAFRWLAMARFYEQHDLLTQKEFNYEQAAANLAFRWHALAKWYERMGMLNERSASQRELHQQH